MFANWKQEKATTALIVEAEDHAARLAAAKPHVRDGQLAYAQLWEGVHAAKGQDVQALMQWKPAMVGRFATATQARIAVLRKERAYESSDGLAVWLMTARAATEPRMIPAVREVWRHLMTAGPNSETMAAELLAEAGLPDTVVRQVPPGFQAAD